MNPDFQPASGNVFAAAVQWIELTLLGSVATSVSVIAVACVGFLLLQGRIDVRRGAQVIFGCFILFGASSIAAGIVRAANGGNSGVEFTGAAVPEAPTYSLPSAQRAVPVTPYDPYAGAALPTGR